MKLNDLIILMPKKNWVSAFQNIENKKPLLNISKEEFKSIIDSAIININNNRKGKCFDWLALAMWINKDLAFDKLKREGFFRIYSYITTQNQVPVITEFLLKHLKILNLSPVDISYLNSVANFASLHPILQQKRQLIIKELSKRKSVIVKSLYSYIDALFQSGVSIQENDDVLKIFPKEEIAEGASYVVSMYKDFYGLNDDAIVQSDISYILSNEIKQLLKNACQIKLIQEGEIWIESLGYTCEKVNTEIVIKPPSPEFGKSYKLGNILLDMNREGQSLLPPRSAYIYDLAKSFNDHTNGAILHWDEHSKRYMLAIPEGVYSLMYEKDKLLSDGLFQEEILYFMEVEDELFLPFKKFKDFEIVAGLNFHDLHIIKRVFTFITLAYFDLLKQKAKQDYHSSNIPFLHPNTIKTLLIPAIGETKTELFLEVFSFSNESKKVFDMQYTPLLLGKEYYLVPYNVLINSNLFRNILFPLNSRLFNSSVDPIGNKLEKLLSEKGFLIKRDLKFKYNRENSDIDVLAVKGNDIFIFECKNSVLAVNAFELRTVFQELKKAAEKQLPLSTSACKDVLFLKTYGIKVEDENKPINIYPCIVTTNRLFSGYVLNGMPIRNIKQMAAFVGKGEMGFTGIEDDGNAVYSSWECDDFKVSDLIEYIKPDTKFYSYCFDSMFEHLQKYDLGEVSLNFSIYPYDENLLIENFKHLGLKKKRNFDSIANEKIE